MPRSRRRNGTSQKTHDQLIRAEARRQRAEGRGWRGRVALPVILLGGALFLAGNITSRAGIVLLAFDRHHVVTQFGGAAIMILGVGWLGRRT